MSGPIGRPPRSSRGQTALDFAVGMGVFLLAVGFAFSFVPAMFQPFDTTGEGSAVIADRSATHLTEMSLSAGGSPGMLDRDCTVAFFGDTGGDDCRWESRGDTADSLRDELGLGSHTGVNVTVERDGSLQEIDDVRLAAGAEPPRRTSVSMATRLVSIGGAEHRLSVRVW